MPNQVERYSCTCIAVPGYDRSRGIDPDCMYHKQAAERPFEHSIAWNCPTYHDGCNCKKVVKELKAQRDQALAKLEELAEEFERRANHPQLWSPDPTYTAAASLTRKQIAELKGGGDG